MKLDLNELRKQATALMRYDNLDVYIAPDLPKDKLEKHLDFFKNNLNYSFAPEDVIIFIDYLTSANKDDFSGLIVTKDEILFKTMGKVNWKVCIENIQLVGASYCDIFLFSDNDGDENKNSIIFPGLNNKELTLLKSLIVNFISQITNNKINNIDDVFSNENSFEQIFSHIDKMYDGAALIAFLATVYYDDAEADIDKDDHAVLNYFTNTIIDFLVPSDKISYSLLCLEHLVEIDVLDRQARFVREKFSRAYSFCLKFISEAVGIDKAYLNEHVIMGEREFIFSRVKLYLKKILTNVAPKIDTISASLDEAKNRLINQDIRELRVIETPKKIEEPKSSGSSGAISSFIDNNASSILSALKQNGLSLTTAALENEEK